jgi:hypothetical protein
LDRVVLFVSIVLILIGIAGLIVKFTLGCDTSPGAFCIFSAQQRAAMHIVPTVASFHDIEGVSGYMLLFGFLLLPMGLFKDGPPILGAAGKAFAMIMVIVVASLGLTILFIATASAAPIGCSSLTIGKAVSILPGSGSNLSLVITFSPKNITITSGTTVEWVNNDSTTHTVTSLSGAPASFDSGGFAPGATFCYTFSNLGTFPYHCTIHPWMRGFVIVKAA